MFRYARFLLVASALFAACPRLSQAQPVASANKLHPDFSDVARRIHDLSGGVLGLVRASKSGSPQLLVAHPGLGKPWLKPSERTSAPLVLAGLRARIPELRSLLALSESADLELTSLGHVGHLWHASFSLSYGGIPVIDRSLSVNLGELSGQYVSIANTLPVSIPTAAEPTIDSATLTLEKLRSYLWSPAEVSLESHPSLCYIENPATGDLILSYVAELRDTVNAHLWKLSIDAQTGALVSLEDELEYVTPPMVMRGGRVVAHVHPQCPFDSSVVVGLPHIRIHVDGSDFETDSNGNWLMAIHDTARSATVEFDNTYQEISRADTSNSSLCGTLSDRPWILEWNDSNSNAAERDAFYSAAIAHDYAKSLDSTLTALDAKMKVLVNLNQTCNAYYDPSLVTLNFFHSGNNCSNTAEIADVVYHEYGHRMLHARYGATQHGNIVNGSMNEAFADLFSAFLRDDSRIGIGFFSNNRFATLRDCFNTKSYPKDISPDPHSSGQILAGAFWDLRRALGRTATQELFNKTLMLCPDAPNSTSATDLQTGFVTTLMDLIAVDDTDNDLSNGSPNLPAILKAFAKHGISLSEFIHLAAQSVPDQDSLAEQYPVTAHATYSAQIGDLADSSMRLYYSFDNGQNYQSAVMTHVDDSTFVGYIPKAPVGTVVRYYTSASTTIENGGTAFSPWPYDPALFLVGYSRYYFDDAESDRGWALSAPTDKAKTGLWVRDVPYGTYQVPGIFVQQDTDHTPDGVACYVTGNKHTRSFTEDDVDSGATSLTTPSFDLTSVASPVIRYWYYYYNSYGFNAGKAPWVTQISNDDGVTWKTAQNTSTATNGWQCFTFRVSDKVAPTSKMRMRFVAADYYATVIEAGVDDFEILNAPAGTLASVATVNDGSFGLSLPHPNPAVAGSDVTVTMRTAGSCHLVLLLKNVFGDVVRTYIDQTVNPGSYDVPVSVARLTPGTYWLVLSDGSRQSIRRIVVD